jgi:hypothetical protein
MPPCNQKTKGFEMVVKKTKRKTGKVKAIAAQACECGGSCSCGKCGCWKKLGTLVLGIVIGAVACCIVCKKCCIKKLWTKGGPGGGELVFSQEGCLDVSKINPKKLEMIQAKVGNKACITKADLFGGERPGPRKPRKPRAE